MLAQYLALSQSQMGLLCTAIHTQVIYSLPEPQVWLTARFASITRLHNGVKGSHPLSAEALPAKTSCQPECTYANREGLLPC